MKKYLYIRPSMQVCILDHNGNIMKKYRYFLVEKGSNDGLYLRAFSRNRIWIKKPKKGEILLKRKDLIERTIEGEGYR